MPDHEKATGTFLRRLNMLSLFKNGQPLTAERVHKYLKSNGDLITLRSVQRALELLVECDCLEVVNPDRKPLQWRLASDKKRMMFSRMTPYEALVFRMVERILKPLLPNDCYMAVRPYLAMAEYELNRLPHGDQLRHFEAKVQILPALPGLSPVDLGGASATEQQAWETRQQTLRDHLLKALCEGRQCEIAYQIPQRDHPLEWDVHPFVLVQCGRAFYLLGAIAGHDEVQALALHRMTAVCIRENKAHSLRSYGFRDEVEVVQCFQELGEERRPVPRRRFATGSLAG